MLNKDLPSASGGDTAHTSNMDAGEQGLSDNGFVSKAKKGEKEKVYDIAK